MKVLIMWKQLLLGVLVSVIAGCGYTFQGTGSVLPPDVKRIYIPMAENNSTEAGLSTILTEALRDRFERYGVVEVVDDIGSADAVLRTRITKVRRATGTVTSTDTALQEDLTMTMAADLRRVTGPVLWRNMSLSVTRTFGSASGGVVTTSADFTSGTLGATDLAALEGGGTREVARGQESEALGNLADKAAQIIYDSAVAPDF